MFSSEAYRKDPTPYSVDISCLGTNESSWLLLLMVEDEISRSKSTRYHLGFRYYYYYYENISIMTKYIL